MITISNRIFSGILAFAFAAVSCEQLQPQVSDREAETREEQSDTDDGAFQKVTSALTACAEDYLVFTQTRTGYQLDGDIFRFFWSDDDHIGFWPEQKDLLSGTVPEQASFYVRHNPSQSNKAVFEACGWGLIKNRRYFAYYPFDASASFDCVRIHYDYQRQTQDNSTAHLSAFDYMHSCVDVTGDDKGQADFKHLGCIAAFTLSIPQDYRSCSFTSLVLSADTPVFVTEATYNPSASQPVLTAAQTASDFSISLGSGTGISCDANGKLNIFMAMSPSVGSIDWSDATINLTLNSSDSRQFTASMTPGIVQQAGVLYPFSVNMEYDGPVTVNLSQQETANSYIVSGPGDYMFRASKGNSSEYVAPSSVKVLWETVNTATKPNANMLINSDVRFSNGYIFFSTPQTFTEGNALIAAYSGLNYTGDILWSWHIWFTDLPADQEYPNNAGLLMDRNLGALSTSGNLSIGLLYQWGRKDPMMGHVSTSSSAAMDATPNGTTTVAHSSTTGTVAWSIKNPASFIIGGGNGDWLYSNPKAGTDYDISNPDIDKSLWYGGAEIKTKYDPCPPGYMIPYSGPSVSDKDFWGKAYNIAFRIGGSNGCFNLGGVNASYTANSGLQMPLADGQMAFYPIAGYISSGGARTNDGMHTMLWTYFPAGSGGETVWNWQYSSCLDVNLLSYPAFTTHWNSTRADGKSVRCLRMKKAISAGNEGFGTPINSEW